MPIYEYVCETCHKQFERWSSQVRDELYTEICPHDGGVGKRVISKTNFQLKGNGWAKDGYSDSKKETSDKS